MNMARSCSLCNRDDRESIDRELVSRESNRRIASQCDVSEAAVRRHREHIPQALVKASEAEEVSRADDLLTELRELQARTWQILFNAEAESDHRTALAAIKEARANLAMMNDITETRELESRLADLEERIPA